MKQYKIGILTSGGDAPGMNAAIRAVVRTAESLNMKVVGIKKGYNGLINGDISEMNARSVSEIMHRGGTILLTARAPEMMTEEGVQRAAQVYKVLGLDCLAVIGGDGSIRGAEVLSNYGVNSMCIPATIDLDLDCSEYTIGFDTAVNTGMEAINKLRDTSSSHERCSVVEVMGRNAGYIAAWCAITGGAEEVILPERGSMDSDAIVAQILENRAKGKTHNLIVVAEGVGKTTDLARYIQKSTGIETRATILGHLQRGGTPTAVDRMHASMMGNMAIRITQEGKRNRVMALMSGQYVDFDISEALGMKKTFNDDLYNVLKVLAV